MEQFALQALYKNQAIRLRNVLTKHTNLGDTLLEKKLTEGILFI